ncbi:hypothetical protein [Tardiphaga sp.]|uniref:hypothetical protein n=1 Tax=Tardiphaga sp. TaxID=1926292 RepID=UPI0037D9EDC2
MTERFNFIAIMPVGVFCFTIIFIDFSSASVQSLRGLVLDFGDEDFRAPALAEVFDAFAFAFVAFLVDFEALAFLAILVSFAFEMRLRFRLKCYFTYLVIRVRSSIPFPALCGLAERGPHWHCSVLVRYEISTDSLATGTAVTEAIKDLFDGGNAFPLVSSRELAMLSKVLGVVGGVMAVT